MPTADARLASLLGDTPHRADQFSGDIRAAVWLPNEPVARAWAEYVRDGDVTDSTPPPAPTRVQLVGDQLSWEAEADLESGLAHFVIRRDGTEIGRVPSQPSGSIGRQVFQRTGYSDTPTPPLAEMRFAVPETSTTQTYEVVSVNSVGLRSEATPSAR
jgi:hypothetical protein